jgi:hypothetical protein
LETGRAVVNVQLANSADDTRGVDRNIKSGQIFQHSRNYWGPAVKRWILKSIVTELGHLGWADRSNPIVDPAQVIVVLQVSVNLGIGSVVN